MSNAYDLTKLTAAARMLAEVKDAPSAKKIMDIASAAEYYARKAKLGQESIDYAHAIKIDAEALFGEHWKPAAKNKGAKGSVVTGRVRRPVKDDTPTLDDLGMTKDKASESLVLADIKKSDPETFKAIKTGKTTISKAKRAVKKTNVAKKLAAVAKAHVAKPSGEYDCIVIDPPWPIQKIDRDVRPNQVAMDYPTMTVDDIAGLKIPAAADCHLWLWTTQRFLPQAFAVLEAWRLKYVCCFVWHKPGGFQPIDLPQFNCEFALYARKGSPLFLETTALNTCFSAPRGKHSEKPEEFYAMVRRITGGRRLDMFNRREIKDFDTWGQEAI